MKKVLNTQKSTESNHSNSGQAFIEFLFLLIALIGISFGLIKGVNGSLGERWKGIISTIASPSPSLPLELKK